MIRERIATLLSFFTPREVPERATTPEESLSVHVATQRVDSAYERFRNLLDPGDEDILRRKAIMRFLGRRWAFTADPETFSLDLLKNLAYGKYIPGATHRRYTRDIAVVVQKAFTFWQLSNRTTHTWFLPLLSVEIDRILYPREADDALVYAFFEDTLERIVWEDETVEASERKTQLFLACHRALAKTDDAELFWHLFRTAEPSWIGEASEEDLEHVAEHFPRLQEEIEQALHHPAAVRLLRKMQLLAVPYRILRDILRQEHAEAILENPTRLASAVQAVLTERIRRLERQMFRRVWHAALFLFLSKGVLAFSLEIPYEWFFGNIRVVPLFINFFFPPTVLLLMTGSIPRPGKANTDRLIQILQTLVSGEGKHPESIVRTPQKTAVRRSIFTLIYGFFSLVLFAGIFWFLRVLNFSLLGGFFFVVFLGLVSFLGLRLRSSMRELRVVVPQQRVIGALLDFLTLPMIDLGRQIALRASQINVFLFLLDAIIEAPFKLLIGLVEEWFTYLRERKEELV